MGGREGGARGGKLAAGVRFFPLPEAGEPLTPPPEEADLAAASGAGRERPSGFGGERPPARWWGGVFVLLSPRRGARGTLRVPAALPAQRVSPGESALPRGTGRGQLRVAESASLEDGLLAWSRPSGSERYPAGLLTAQRLCG